MSGFNPTPAVFHKRRDGSMFMSFGNPIHGFHNQFDFYGVEKLGEHIAVAVNAYDKQRALIENMVSVMASLAAAISLLERSPKTAAPSDKMFDQMLDDYRNALEAARAAIAAAKEQSA